MAENENNVQTENVVAPSPEEVLVKMKENYVPKEEAEQYKQKYYELFQSVANGTFTGEEKESTITEEQSNIDYQKNLLNIATANGPLATFQAMVNADDYLTSHGKRSLFAASDGDLSDSDVRTCERTNALLKDVIEKSEGDVNVALAYLGTKLNDAIKLPANRR